MRVVSTTLAGQGAAAIIADSLRSARSIADEFVVISTGVGEAVGEDEISDAAAGAIGAERLQVRRWPWSGRFDEARNVALDAAASTGAPWAIMLDPDDRVVCPDPAALRGYLEALPPSVVAVVAMSEDGAYGRERFFRLPARHRFEGRTHEAFRADNRGQMAMAPPKLVSWRELLKTPAQCRAKIERDLLLLREEIAEHPNDPRWHYYLGSTLQAFGRHDEAVDAFLACLALGRGEAAAFACVRAAQSLIVLKQFDRALEVCCAGLARYPGIAELCGLAAVACTQLRRVDEAEDWAHLAKVHALGSAAERRRLGFRLPEWLTVGPDEVLKWVRCARGIVTG